MPIKRRRLFVSKAAIKRLKEVEGKRRNAIQQILGQAPRTDPKCRCNE